MSPTELTALGALLVSVFAVIVLPLWFRRQTARQLRAEREETARQLRIEREETAKQVARQQEIAAIKEQAKLEAATAAGDTVTWDKMNQRLSLNAQEERAAHQERINELRANFATETERIKQRTDHELDRAKEEIRRLSDRVQELTLQITKLASRGEK